MMPRILICVGLLWLSMTAGAHAVSGATTQTLQLPMQSWSGYFLEQCIEMQANQTIQLSVASPYPVKLNVHHHTATETLFLIDQVVTDASVASAKAQQDGEYCIEVTNHETRDARYDLRLEYAVLAD